MTRLILATRNAHKVYEIAHHLAVAGVEVVGLDAYPEIPAELPETGSTFHDNALQKARFVHQITGVPACADDSGIEVDALDGRPGVHSKRFSPEGTDASNNLHLLALLGERPDRAARYRCVLAVVGRGPDLLVDGVCEGAIGLSPSGSGGFGYDPLFLPVDAPGRTMAELTPAEKDTISHRGRALRRLLSRLAAADVNGP